MLSLLLFSSLCFSDSLALKSVSLVAPVLSCPLSSAPAVNSCRPRWEGMSLGRAGLYGEGALSRAPGQPFRSSFFHVPQVVHYRTLPGSERVEGKCMKQCTCVYVHKSVCLHV